MLRYSSFAKQLSRAFGRGSGHKGPTAEADPLSSFQSESSPRPSPARATSRRFPRLVPRRPAIVVVGATAILSLAAFGITYLANTHVDAARPAERAVPATGSVTIDSHPPGSVVIDDVTVGQTPLSLRLPAGAHRATVTAGSATRTFSLDVEAGTTVRQNVEFATEPATTAGRLEVTSTPPGARVNVDGAMKGVTPFSSGDISAGTHAIVISKGDASVRRSVTIRAGATSSVDVSVAAPDAAAGWLAVASPVELTLAEDDQIIGTTKAARVMLPAGAHDLVLSNAALEFQTTMMVRVEDGKTVKRSVTLPNGSLSVNAVPWASVTVDGNDLGTTPLANVPLPIGTHEVVWRNPQLGERRRTVTITAKAPTRIGMDFKQ